tara:strand:+ start:375 stop:1055 length:681 start_codon:yes stop_codon:yes gene_type:complete
MLNDVTNGGSIDNYDGNLKRKSNPKQIFVKDLPTYAREDKIREFFTQYGTIVQGGVFVKYYKNTQLSLGYAIVIFKDEDVVENLIRKRFVKFDKKHVKINTCWARTRTIWRIPTIFDNCITIGQKDLYNKDDQKKTAIDLIEWIKKINPNKENPASASGNHMGLFYKEYGKHNKQIINSSGKLKMFCNVFPHLFTYIDNVYNSKIKIVAIASFSDGGTDGTYKFCN